MTNTPQNKKVVVIGGGTGTFAILSGLKHYPLDISAVINMTDSGGSTGRLRDQYGVLPPGDVRQALVALSDSDKIWRKLFLYRFETGDLQGHNFGNILLAALEKVTRNFERSIEAAESILNTRGSVIPVTLNKTHLVATLADGTVIKTEAFIDVKEQRPRIVNLALIRQTKGNPKAVSAIEKADLIIIAPGDLYTSILPNFMFKDIVQAFKKSTASKVLVANLMNKIGQTDDFALSDYIKVYEKYLGPKPFTHALVNDREIPRTIISLYAESKESSVKCDIRSSEQMTIYKNDFISDHIYGIGKGDILDRSLLRHDGHKVGKLLRHLFFK
ncbi:MAG: gluconeogenesis factor YvcK family protein [Patescibacteria group bacterium]|jgi:uncharacterized cofD-like protein